MATFRLGAAVNARLLDIDGIMAFAFNPLGSPPGIEE
jgi:hypothetical protein